MSAPGHAGRGAVDQKFVKYLHVSESSNFVKKTPILFSFEILGNEMRDSQLCKEYSILPFYRSVSGQPSGEPTQFKEWIFAVDLSLGTGMIKDGQDQVDFASSFLKGTALLWFLSCLESRRTFANSAELKESLSATFSPWDREEDDRLNLFGLTQTGPLDDHIQDFSHLSLNVTALDEHSRAKDHLITGTAIL